MALTPGSKLGPYEILGLIGAGGMGEVHRARDTRLGREVAIKTLPAGLATDTERLRRFELEAKAASLLSHPNILTVFDVGASDGKPYIVSELLEGEAVGVADGGDEVVAGDGLPVVALEVQVEPAPEAVAADQRLQHPDDFGAFLVDGDRVEVVDLLVRVGVRRRERLQLEREPPREGKRAAPPGAEQWLGHEP